MTTDLMMRAAQRLVNQSPTYPPNLAETDPVRLIFECLRRLKGNEVALEEVENELGITTNDLETAQCRASEAEDELSAANYTLGCIRKQLGLSSACDHESILDAITALKSSGVQA